MEVYKKERLKERKRKKEVNEQFGRKRIQDVNGNRKKFYKEVHKVNGGKLESIIKDRNWRLALRKDLEGVF